MRDTVCRSMYSDMSRRGGPVPSAYTKFGDAGPAGHHGGDIAHADLLALGRGAGFRLGEALFEIGDRRIGQLAGAAPIAVALGAFELGARLVELFFETAALRTARLRGAPR